MKKSEKRDMEPKEKTSSKKKIDAAKPTERTKKGTVREEKKLQNFKGETNKLKKKHHSGQTY